MVWQQGRNAQDLFMLCFPKVLYVTAFGFVGCILFTHYLIWGVQMELQNELIWVALG